MPVSVGSSDDVAAACVVTMIGPVSEAPGSVPGVPGPEGGAPEEPASDVTAAPSVVARVTRSLAWASWTGAPGESKKLGTAIELFSVRSWEPAPFVKATTLG